MSEYKPCVFCGVTDQPATVTPEFQGLCPHCMDVMRGLSPDWDAMVVAEIAKGVVAEREACVKAVEDWWGNHKTREKYPNPANVIRARSK